ncbi:tRNA endonuclease ANKZF1 [Oncorhynchus nerka]|uniref:tRNA endonuclease ANKZF1 n=1 Tax=Oncorhynchus nerka TaxID=8023 RepID=UPI0031B86463
MTAGPEHRSVFEYCLQDSALQEVREVTSVHEPPVEPPVEPPEHTKNPPHSHGVTGCPKEDLQDDLQPESSLGRDVSDRMVCSACQCPFDTREEQMEHYKLDWHRFNLRQRPSGKTPATVEEFERKTGGGDMSSISGSDSEDEEPDSDWVVENTEAAPLQKDRGVLEAESFRRLSNRVVFQNSQGQYLAVYRCVLQSKSAIEEDLVASLQSLSNKTMWVILMAGGGHFAGAVFQGREVLQHKTFHRYTVRAKRGTAQGLRDAKNSSHAPKSAGAALRRYNESALVKEIQDLLESWSDHLMDASAIFLRAPSHNKTLFLGGKAAPLGKKDPRIRTLPFPTRRATFREIKRVHDVLSTLNVYGKDTDISDILSPSNKVWKKARTPVAQPEPSQETTAPLVEEEESSGEELETVEVTLGTLDLREHEIYPARRKKRRRRTEDRGLSNREAVGSPAAPEDSNQERGGEKNQGRRKPKGKTRIQHEEGEVQLLMDAGSDPACRDLTGQTPYIVAPDKDTRNVFRKYMAEYPDKYNYSKALVPGPLTAELESKKTEKKRAQKAAKKTREKEQKEQRKRLETEAEEKKRFASLSDREKRAQAAEKRLAEHQASTGGDILDTRRCWQCGESLVGKVPFQYLDFSFCTPRCVQEHRKANVANRSRAGN